MSIVVAVANVWVLFILIVQSLCTLRTLWVIIRDWHRELFLVTNLGKVFFLLISMTFPAYIMATGQISEIMTKILG